MAALEGMTVVAFEQAVAAPLATARLADAGARVIKIERAEGDFAREYDHAVHGSSSYFVWLNAGKESIVADIKDPDDNALLHDLIADADIVVQNFAPGALERSGFGSARLRSLHRRLVTCDISGFGDGPYRDRKAYDLLIQAETGLASVTGTPDAPGRVGISICDITAGQAAYSAILEAIIKRGRTGRGSGVAISLFDVMAELMTVPLLHHNFAGRGPMRVGLAHPSIAPYGVYETLDGEIVLAVQNEREWKSFCAEVLAVPGLSGDSRFTSNSDRVRNQVELHAELGPRLRAMTSAELQGRLLSARIAYAPVNDVASLSRHPHLRGREIEIDGRMAKIVAPPARWSEQGQQSPARVPTLDEHGPAIRKALADRAAAAPYQQGEAR